MNVSSQQEHDMHKAGLARLATLEAYMAVSKHMPQLRTEALALLNAVRAEHIRIYEAALPGLAQDEIREVAK